MQYKHGQYGHAAGRAALTWACTKNMRQEHAAWKCSM
jgi:hypothetical protein